MAEPAWNEQGLVPAVVADARTGAVLMLAWMNREALQETRRTGLAHFYSRSRNALWKKGETSGNTLAVQEIRVDCDADAILLVAHPAGPACHTGKTSCFYRRLDGRAVREDEGPSGAPSAILERLEDVIHKRRREGDGRQSYTKSLLEGGFPRILAKIREEARELEAELPAGAEAAIVHETVDLLYHVLVGLAARDVALAAVWHELAGRFGVSGHAEKASRPTGKAPR